jgi:hypothetical protein
MSNSEFLALKLDVYVHAETDSRVSIHSLSQATLSALGEQPVAKVIGQFAPVESGLGATQNKSLLFQKPGLFSLVSDNYFSLPGDRYFNIPPNVSMDLGPAALSSIQFVCEWYSITVAKR